MGSLTRATYGVLERDLQRMVLERDQLPLELGAFEQLREAVLDNETMAERGFPGNTAEGFRQIGRISGYLREFASPDGGPLSPEGTDLVAATVAHLFDDEAGVLRWMNEVFLRQFEENVGSAIGHDQELVAVERLTVEGFNDEAVGIRAVQNGPDGLLSSSVIDFRVGRLLGVAFVVTVGDCERWALAESLAGELERQMVRVALASG